MLKPVTLSLLCVTDPGTQLQPGHLLFVMISEQSYFQALLKVGAKVGQFSGFAGA